MLYPDEDRSPALCWRESPALMATLLMPQEREEAQRLAETDPEALTADRTFEPGEGLVEAEGPAEDEEMAAVPEPTARKGPTPEQITAIKVSTPLPPQRRPHKPGHGIMLKQHAADRPQPLRPLQGLNCDGAILIWYCG